MSATVDILHLSLISDVLIVLLCFINLTKFGNALVARLLVESLDRANLLVLDTRFFVSDSWQTLCFLPILCMMGQIPVLVSSRL